MENIDKEKFSKKQLKRQIRNIKWQEIKMKKKAEQKQQKQQEKEKQKQEQQVQQLPDNQNQEQKKVHTTPYKTNQALREEYTQKQQKGLPVIIDMQFLSLINEKEYKSMVTQLMYMQSVNKKAKQPCRFIITSANDKLKQSLQTSNANNWGIEIYEKHYTECFPKENLIYLTGDSQEDVEELNFNLCYIIGGLVDHNRLKNITYNKANSEGIKTMRFPIQKHIKLESSSILACNHVFDILVQKSNGFDWKQSFLNAIPERKIIATIENGVEVLTESFVKRQEQNLIKQQEQNQKKLQLKEKKQQNKEINEELQDELEQ